jgi:DNA-binding CsgD family transcriptional regulator
MQPRGDTKAPEWVSLAPQGFPGYEVSRAGMVRREGAERCYRPNKVGAVGLTDRAGVKRCVLVGKLCRLAHGDAAPGATSPRAKLTRRQVSIIRTATRTAPVELAARLGVSPSTVKAARAGVTWASVPTETRAHYTTDAEAMQPQAA